MAADILIVGGGLSGLVLAKNLDRAGLAFELIEARARFGGRIHGLNHAGTHFDLGPAWFWPGQPRMAQLTSDLELTVFEQFSLGAQLYEDEAGHLHKGRGFASMAGSLRVDGGFSALVRKLVNSIPGSRLHLSSELTQLTKTSDGVTATLRSGSRIDAKRVVLALPPRLATNIALSPELPNETTKQLANTPTWMAGQAKALAIYKAPFWRDAGLSGDAMSRVGPIAEMHDASPVSGTTGAIFGFLGVPPNARTNRGKLERATQDQLSRFFGKQAGTPDFLTVQDWATEPFTATLKDGEPLYAHPTYTSPTIADEDWKDRLFFAGSETDREFGGYLEGALKAVETVTAKLLK